MMMMMLMMLMMMLMMIMVMMMVVAILRVDKVWTLWAVAEEEREVLASHRATGVSAAHPTLRQISNGQN